MTGKPSRSDPVRQPTTAVQAVADLHALLTAAGVPGPYVLVGHSYGGAVSRLYAATYPGDVVGMVSVDALPADLLRAALTPNEWRIFKLLNTRTPKDIAKYPPLERLRFDQVANEVRAGGKLSQMPLVVLAANHKYGPEYKAAAAHGNLPKGVPADFGYVIDRSHAQTQPEIARLVAGARFAKVNSGHLVPIDNAPAVIAAIDQVLDAVRSGRSTVTG